MSEWKEYKLGEIITIKYGKDHKHLKDGSFPVYGSGGIMRYVEKYLYDKESILIPRKGSLSNIFYKDSAFWTVDTMFWTEIDSTKVFPKFLYYQMTLIDLEILNVGSAVPSLTIPVINDIPISLPSLSEQKRIASILSSLDDKIDLLHRENKTLEAMAETLFRQWFVEEAKEDWKEVSLTKVANFLNGLACQKYPPKNEIEKLPVLKIRELSNGIGKDCDWATTDIANEYIVYNGDVIFAWSASLMVKIWDGEECVLNQHLFKVTSDKYPKWFYYFWCKYHLDEFITIAQSHATTMGHIKRKDLENAMVLVPTGNELKTMSKQIESLLQKIENNNNEIKTLTQTRDGLLPKLMSGEVKI
jgi:type I restriction enzyme S subunit